MNITSIDIEHKEKRSTLEITVYCGYFIKTDNKGGRVIGHNKTVILLKKPTKKELIKSAKEEERRRSNENY